MTFKILESFVIHIWPTLTKLIAGFAVAHFTTVTYLKYVIAVLLCSCFWFYILRTIFVLFTSLIV